MNLSVARVILLTCIFNASSALAQEAIDPSTALLLNPTTTSEPATRALPRSEPRLESGRYTVRPRATEKPAKRPTDSGAVATPAPAPNPTPVSMIRPEPPEAVATPAPSATPVVEPIVEPVALKPNAEGNVVVPMAAEPDLQDPPEHRLLEISIGSAYLYEDSDSSFSYRQSTLSGPAYVASGRSWLTPHFALAGRYISTLGGNVTDRPTPTTSSTVGASRTETAFGIFYKQFFESSDLTFGVELVDSQFKVPNDTVSKTKTKSVGLRVSVEGEFAKTESTSWRGGFSMMPKSQHEEHSTRTEVRSGASVDSFAVGASLERRWKFDDANAVYVRAEHRLERNLYSGVANVADPLTGVAPSGVAVTVGTTLIQFGYTWGN